MMKIIKLNMIQSIVFVFESTECSGKNIAFSIFPYYMMFFFFLLGFVNPLPHGFWRTGGKSLLKTLWEKKKMLVTSIFFFSQNVYYPMKDNFNIMSNI